MDQNAYLCQHCRKLQLLLDLVEDQDAHEFVGKFADLLVAEGSLEEISTRHKECSLIAFLLSELPCFDLPDRAANVPLRLYLTSSKVVYLHDPRKTPEVRIPITQLPSLNVKIERQQTKAFDLANSRTLDKWVNGERTVSQVDGMANTDVKLWTNVKLSLEPSRLVAFVDPHKRSGNPAARYIGTRPDTSIDSDTAFDSARRWMSICQRQHKACPREQDVTLPSRVIDVCLGQNEPSVLLHCQQGVSKGRYITLSYCWGGDQPIKLSKSNIGVWQNRIPSEGLPKTLIDAIECARRLSIRYLWVDSLCIIQDDEEDVASEIAKMPRIFNDAVVCIVAANSSSSTNGFLTQKSTSTPEQLFQLFFRGPDGLKGSLSIVNSRTSGYIEPIELRAWTLQESMLSPCKLVYGSSHLQWFCPSVQYTHGMNVEMSEQQRSRWMLPPELDDIFRPSLPISTSKLRKDVNNMMLALTFKRTSTLEKESLDVWEDWKTVISNYSKRELSFHRDKLLALSGVAERFGRTIKSDYLAGLWASYLPWGLLWKTRPVGRITSGHSHRYIAPSWSWASTDVVIEWSELSVCKDTKPLIRIREHQAQPTFASAPYGDFVQCRLVIKGWLRQGCSADKTTLFGTLPAKLVTEVKISVESDHFRPRKTTSSLGVPAQDTVSLRRESSRRFWQRTSAWCIQLAWSRQAHCYAGLVLKHIEDDIFTRVGIFHASTGVPGGEADLVRCFSGWETKTITIL